MKLTVIAGLGAGLLLAATAPWVGSAIADEGHGDETPHGPSTSGDETIVPEPETKGPILKVNRDLLEKVEIDFDPAGTAHAYVCANEGDEEYTVVMGKAAPADAEPDPNAERRLLDDTAPLDPCIDKKLVVGKDKRR